MNECVIKKIDDSIFFELFGKSQHTKMLDLFLECRDEMLCFSDIADKAKIKRGKIQPILKIFLTLDLIKQKTIRNRVFYQVNKQNIYFKNLDKIYTSISLNPPIIN